LASLHNKVVDGKYALTLFAGIRPKIASILLEMVQCAGLANHLDKNIKILLARDLQEYFHTFNECLANTDVLWTKPSELIFYASLGLPLLLADPVGGQEHANRKWLLSKDAGLDAGAPSEFARRIDHLLATGELYRIAGNAYSRLERNGLTRIIEILNKHTDRRPS
jgi:UDP-N-acetylglucosamine:LPS N-acetylglucosamine transferase